jgi:hypothetical protein
MDTISGTFVSYLVANEQNVSDTCARKQLSEAATDV